MANYSIPTSLPFGGGGANQFMGLGGSASQSLANLGTGYASAYNSALAMNQTNYQNVAAGYGNVLANNQSARAGVGQGYDQLLSSVLGGISNMAASRQHDLNAQYTANSGQQAQQLIDRGLGNTTVQQSVQRGLMYDQARSSTDLANAFAGTTANFQSSLGQAGLGYQERAINANDQDAMRQLDWMNSVQAAYPDAGMYSQLAQQLGAAQQQEADRNRAMGGAFGGGPPIGSLSYAPGAGGLPPLQTGGSSYGFSQPGGGVLAWNANNTPAAWAGIGAKAYGFDSPDKGAGGPYSAGFTPGESKGYGSGGGYDFDSMHGPGASGGYDVSPGWDRESTGYNDTGSGWGDVGAALGEDNWFYE